jgi:hypothetical protein
MPLLHGRLSASTRAQVKTKPPWAYNININVAETLQRSRCRRAAGSPCGSVILRKRYGLGSSHHGVESEDDEDDSGRHEDPKPSSLLGVDYAECRQICEESKLFRLLVGELADDEAVVCNSYGSLEMSALWEIAKSGYEC